ncbi:MAG: VOC family protein [Acidimicrobiia bacterium]|nr:VOC family protein [Acidimicrobiia bacterium]
MSSHAPTTGRVQLALDVTDLDASIRFYTDLFGVEPGKVRESYANFSIDRPPLKLVLFSGDAAGINHLGVELASVDQVDGEIARLTGAEVPLDIEEKVTCCYATQHKAWATAPDGERWEYYTVLADAEQLASDAGGQAPCACNDASCSCASGGDGTVISSACCTEVA